ncbi:ubiquitinyl hydrolase [Tothia fuscella]|uniref:Ubiquitin carboxyl-terminal hydrolase n=1 Tax=Tothia fuscella TaxID=1048955 RepID=A0A9P4NRS9_9PEZI|nr:ubiquitinyl hydrolase [Tothia fuscella]
MASGWSTIESDAGVFTYVLDGLGAKDLQFEELFSLDLLQDISPVYGVIFLFKYLSGEKAGGEPLDGAFDHDAAENLFFVSSYQGKSVQEENPHSLHYFDYILLGQYYVIMDQAQQTIQNACGTQALLSIVLNSDVSIGAPLQDFKEFTSAFPSELRGECLSNSELIRSVHNSFARASPFVDETTRLATDDDDVYHFIAYVPINGILYELDGLNPAPISHGACSFRDFPEKVIPVLERRISRYPPEEIRFNLLAMTRDLRIHAREIGDMEMLRQEQRKRTEWQWENALRRHNFVGFIGELTKGVVKAKLNEGTYEKWVDDAKTKTQTRIQERKKRGHGDEFEG